MLFAMGETVDKLRASKGAIGHCPDCNAQMVPKCGRIMIPHWAHKTVKDCDVWSEGETEWHREWKSHFPPEHVEVGIERDGKRHRADVHLPEAVGQIRTIEFQHSSISQDEIEAREAFYGVQEMVWVFDAKKAYEGRRFWFEETGETTTDGKKLRTSNWKHGRKSLLGCDAMVVLDFGKQEKGDNPQHWLFRVTKMGTYWNEGDNDWGHYCNERMTVTGYFRTKDQFISTFTSGILHT